MIILILLENYGYGLRVLDLNEIIFHYLWLTTRQTTLVCKGKHMEMEMREGWYIVDLRDNSLRETFAFKNRSDANRKLKRSKDAFHLIAMSREEYMEMVKSKVYYMDSACVWWRESTKEWVLELEGVINGVAFVTRHAQTGELTPDQVPGLPETYTALDEAPGVAFHTQAWEV